MQRLSARGEALGRLGKIRACDKVRRRKAKRARSGARRECAEAIERFDAFEAAMDTLRGALECVDLETGELHRPEHVEALIEGVAQRIESLGSGGVREAREVPAQPGAGPGAGPEERVAPARGVGRALVGAGGELGVPVLVLGPGAAQASCACPVSCAVSPSPWGVRGTARPARRGERIAAPMPSRRCCTSAIAPRAPSRGSMRHCAPISTCTKALARAFSTCSVPGSICAHGVGDGTRARAHTSV